MIRTVLLFSTLALFSAHITEAGFLIVVNKENKLDEISRKDLKNIYMMKKRTWMDGTQILPLDLHRDEAVRKSFSDQILKKTPRQMTKYYFRRALSGRGQPPKTCITEEEVIDFIRRNRRAIGYISENGSGSVKTIRITGE